VSPKGKMNDIYKVLISLFVFISLIYPLKNYDFSKLKNNSWYVEESVEDVSVSSAKLMISNNVESILNQNDIVGARVESDVSLVDDEIVVNSVVVAIPDEYDLEETHNIIFDELSLNTEVIHIGQ
jgi:hypothetical protein